MVALCRPGGEEVEKMELMDHGKGEREGLRWMKGGISFKGI